MIKESAETEYDLRPGALSKSHFFRVPGSAREETARRNTELEKKIIKF